jgi:STE24 endopeptidase
MIGLILFSWLIGPVEHFLGIASLKIFLICVWIYITMCFCLMFVVNALTRSFEFQADKYAADLGYELGDPLIRIHVENLGNPAPDWLYSMYHASHPPLLERLRAIKNINKWKSQ